MRLILMSFMVLFLCSGCSSTPPKPTPMPKGPYVAMTPEPPPKPIVRVVPVPYAQPVPGQAKPWVKAEPTEAQIEAAKKQTPASILKQANARARQQPAPTGFVNAIQVYDYMPGALYQIYAAPNHVSTITFAPGEELLLVSVGDKTRWKIIEAEAQNVSPMLVIKVTHAKLHSTMVVTSTKRTYLFELKSYQHQYMANVKFAYPQETIRRFTRRAKAQNAKKPKAFAVPLSAIGSHYRMVVKNKDKRPSFTPRRAFVYGKKTYIEFPFQLNKAKLPTPYKLNHTKSTHQVQYAIDGHYLIIGEVVDHLMLRRDGQWVGLERKKGGK